ncbi:hypothetical protein BOO71_0000007 [Deinococcus marmoris]|uniref:Uncharacterized protein n=2 Tax=Deinococcus marmoris TaxID=249408 RepID=A0A1U7NWB0_9DEIO|nr:hypothetical protein BOO71_0009268 [Deinococcus marmoris]OLV20317.1 hypothetical protein BOO71_0000007 [Deinococcus marmoris]
MFSMTPTPTEALLDDLVVDHVLSAGQIKRRYGLRLNPARIHALGLTPIERVMVTVHGAPASVRAVQFVALNPRWARQESWMLGHLAGVAEARTLTNNPRALWRSEAGRLDSARPDAVYLMERGMAAVEFDTGSYDNATVRRKLREFGRTYAHVIYAVSGQRRLTYVRRRLAIEWPSADDQERFTLVHAPWWA